MRKCLVTICAVLMVFAMSASAEASPMDLLNWQAYDNFAGPSLNMTLWQMSPSNNYVICTVNNGLTASVSSGKPNFSLEFTYAINSGNLFAIKFPFSVTGSVQSGGGIAVTMDIGQTGNLIPITWAQVQDYQGGTGKLFVSGPDNNATVISTDVTQGQLGFIYDGSSISTYYNVGAGWQTLYSGIPGWSGPMRSALSAGEILGTPASSMTAFIDNVQFATSYTAPVPEATSLLFLGFGLVGLVGFAKRNLRK